MHGDTPGAQALTRALRAALEQAGVTRRTDREPQPVSVMRGGARDAAGRRAVVAAGLGWMLDAFDVMLFALVLPALRQDLGLSTAAGGAAWLGRRSLAAAAGGVASAGLPIDSAERAR